MEDGSEIHEEISDLDEDSYRLRPDRASPRLQAFGGDAERRAERRRHAVFWIAEIEFAEPGQEAQFLPMLEQGYAGALQRLKEVVEA